MWLRPALQLAAADTGIGSLDIVALNGEEISLARSRNTFVLDLVHLSTRAP